MKRVTTRQDLRAVLSPLRQAGQHIGLVPTMGALHAGHAAHLEGMRRVADVVVLSIFVNPTQFGPTEDLARYPRRPESDRIIAEAAGVDVVFEPSVEELYPVAPETFVEVPALARVWEGASRPTHFRGVTTVVAKLLTVIRPDLVSFGQKDAQQLVVVRRMMRELLFPTTILVIPTVREDDGLAMSSRNAYLTPAERAQAPVLSRALLAAENRIRQGERDGRRLQEALEQAIRTAPLAELDYAAIVDPETLLPLATAAGRVLLLAAARFGAARLIDNRALSVQGERVESILL